MTKVKGQVIIAAMATRRHPGPRSAGCRLSFSSRWTQSMSLRRRPHLIWMPRESGDLKAAFFQLVFGLRLVLFVNHATVEEVNLAVGVLGVARVVRHHADGHALLMQLAHQVHDRFAVGRIEVAGWLVRKQDER